MNKHQSTSINYSWQPWIWVGFAAKLVSFQCHVTRVFYCLSFLWIIETSSFSMGNQWNQDKEYGWLVVYLPLWKIWVRQLGLLFPIYGKKNVANHQPEEYGKNHTAKYIETTKRPKMMWTFGPPFLAISTWKVMINGWEKKRAGDCERALFRHCKMVSIYLYLIVSVDTCF